MVRVVAVDSGTAHNIRSIGKCVHGIPDALFIRGTVEQECRRLRRTLHALPLLAVHGDELAEACGSALGWIHHRLSKKQMTVQRKLLCSERARTTEYCRKENDLLHKNGA